MFALLLPIVEEITATTVGRVVLEQVASEAISSAFPSGSSSATRLHVEADVSACVAALDRMIERIHDFAAHGIRNVVADWETQTVRRKAPGVRHIHAGAKVIFRPHSRAEMRRHYAAMRRLQRKGRYAVGTSTRPILRQVLIDALEDQLAAAMTARLVWDR
jgi:hypothetical protein